MGEIRNIYKILVGKPERNRLLGRHGHRRKDNIKINFEGEGVKEWTRFKLLRIGSCSGIL
jgi:hypothetical protein